MKPQLVNEGFGFSSWCFKVLQYLSRVIYCTGRNEDFFKLFSLIRTQRILLVSSSFF